MLKTLANSLIILFLCLSMAVQCKPGLDCRLEDSGCNAFALSSLLLSTSLDFQVPHTQQSLCYDGTAAQSCPVSGFPRQDADHFRARSFIGLNHGEIARDRETGILWRRCLLGQNWDGSNCSGTATARNYADAQSQCAALSDSPYGPWRLPNFRELNTFFQYSGSSPAIISGVFQNYPTTLGLWSNRTLEANTANALAINLATGAVLSYAKTNTRYVQCVTGPELPLANFITVQPGVVQDLTTGSHWTSCPLMASGILDTSSNCAGPLQSTNWTTALQQCAALDGTAGIYGWRIPTILELFSIPDYTSSSGRMFNDAYFPNGPTGVWVSTTAVYSALTDGFQIRTTATPFDSQLSPKTSTLPHLCIAP